MKPYTLAGVLITLACAAPLSVWSADALRCHGDLAQVGETKASILNKCGEPLTKDTFCKKVERKDSSTHTTIVTGCEEVEEWTYNPGTGSFMATLRFEAGRLASISYGDRAK